MADITDLQKIIWQEFSSQYLPEELPAEWSQSFLEERWPEMARNSALRFKSKIKPQDQRELAILFDNASQNPNHPLIQFICDTTCIDWIEEVGNWEALARLLSLISMNLMRLNNS
jgi:hypothetical protein